MNTATTRSRRPRGPSDEQLLATIVDLVDDGFCPRGELVLRLGVGEREARRAIGRAARSGLVLQRLGLDGRSYYSVSGEGWELLRRAGAGSR
ncbi:MAG: hypothetical protein ACOYD4_13905 [Solirubrobacterales bacterium]